MRRTKRRGISNLAAGLIFLLVAIPLLYLGFTKSIPFRHHFSIKAAFRTSNNLHSGSPVRIAGVNVGKVTDVEHLSGGGNGTVVTMQIDDKGQPIHRDATVSVRPRIFLEGNFFVDLRPGSPSAPILKDGETLPIQQASAPVQLDQILTTLQKDTRRNLQSLLIEYGRGVKGGGPGYDRSIRYWKDAYKYSSLLNEATLGEHPHDLSGYIDAAGAVSAALDAHPPQLKSLVTDFNTTANAFAREDTNLAAAIGELPRTLSVAQPALSALNRAFPPVRRLVVALRPGVRSTIPMINASLPFIRQLRGLVGARELRGLVGDLRPTVPSLARLQNASIPLYQQVRASSSCQLHTILPWTHDRVPNVEHYPFKYNLQVYQESPKFLPGIAEESTEGDANGQWARILGGGGAHTFSFGNPTNAADPRIGTTLNAIVGTAPPKPLSQPPLRPNKPCENQPTPDLRTELGKPPKEMKVHVSAAELTKARDAAVQWERKQIKAAGLPWKVLDRWATKADLPKGARR